jgi:CubicO group peptidase (beta-lactamase class C family)
MYADTRAANACVIDKACDREAFVSAIVQKRPVNLPDTSPLRSDAAFQLLALAVESATKKSIETTFNDKIAAPIGLQITHFLDRNSQLFGSGISNASLAGEKAALGLISTISDLSELGRSILTSAILPRDTTRRWLKPFASTSNLRTAVGRPWEIYHYSTAPTDAITDVYTKSGTVGKYSSYFGLVPSYDVGFAILAVESGSEAPDLNAYADITLGGLHRLLFC